jgi:hypothetical protein
MLMDTFIIVVMLCTWNPGSNQEACTPMVESPKVYYKTEKECESMSQQKRKEIKDIALSYRMRVTEVYSTCVKEGNNS